MPVPSYSICTQYSLCSATTLTTNKWQYYCTTLQQHSAINRTITAGLMIPINYTDKNLTQQTDRNVDSYVLVFRHSLACLVQHFKHHFMLVLKEFPPLGIVKSNNPMWVSKLIISFCKNTSRYMLQPSAKYEFQLRNAFSSCNNVKKTQRKHKYLPIWTNFLNLT